MGETEANIIEVEGEKGLSKRLREKEKNE